MGGAAQSSGGQLCGPRARVAILFVPGLGERDSTDEAALTFAKKLAGALDQTATNERAVFTVRTRTEQTRAEQRIFVSSILRSDQPESAPTEAIDVYKLDYRDLQMKGFERFSAFRRAVLTGLAAASGTKRILRAILHPGRIGGRASIAQLLVAFSLWMLIVAYFIVLLTSFVVLLGSWMPASDAPTSYVGKVWAWLRNQEFFHGGIVAAAFVAGILPAKVRDEITKLGSNYVRLSAYLSVNDGHGGVTGRFHSVLEHMVEVDPAYERIHVVAYSFGSIVALDTLFPREHSGTHLPRLDRIEKLVTIGCPFDFVRSLWPDYYEARIRAADAPRWWLNVYCPADVLGSNFRDDTEPREATAPIAGCLPTKNVPFNAGEFGLLDYCTLLALRSHGMYFGAEDNLEDLGCLRDTAVIAFEGDAFAADPERPRALSA